MKFLLASDIHNNLAAVKRMREQETNSFDALVVAGDIGSDHAQQIFDVLATFECPVLYVYGNWDYKLDYAASFGSACHHLHLAPFQVGPIAFVGFSGCTAHWGQNPEAQRLSKDVDDAHSYIIRDLAAAHSTEEQAKSVIEDEYAASVSELTATSRRKPSQRKLNALDAARRRKLAALTGAVADVENSLAYRQYSRDRSAVSQEALIRNRRALSDLINSLETPRGRVAVVTHDRLFKTQADFEALPIFLFGHRHGLAETKFEGAQYVNVSALDMRRTLIRPKTFASGDHFQQFRNLITGNYAIREWSEGAGFTVKSVDLKIDQGWQEGWELETDFQMPGAPFW